jgi:hypothetical protein
VGAIRIGLLDFPDGSRVIRFEITVMSQTGDKMDIVSGDLVPHLTSGQLTALNNFLDAMRAKAVEVLT